MPLADVFTSKVGVCLMKLACFQDNRIQTKTQLLRRRQIYCHFHPFEELHVLMGKMPDIIKPNSCMEPGWSKKAEEKKHVCMHVSVGGVFAVNPLVEIMTIRKIQRSTPY